MLDHPLLFNFVCRYVHRWPVTMYSIIARYSYIHQYNTIEYSEPLIKDTPTKDMPKALLYKLG